MFGGVVLGVDEIQAGMCFFGAFMWVDASNVSVFGTFLAAAVAAWSVSWELGGVAYAR